MVFVAHYRNMVRGRKEFFWLPSRNGLVSETTRASFVQKVQQEGEAMVFLPELSVLMTFSIAAIALALTPGPDMTLFLSKTIGQGRSAGFAAFLGAITGLLIHTLAVALGLSALLVTSAAAFTALKIAGCLYLLWLAWDALRNRSSFAVSTSQRRKETHKSVYFKGLWINLFNPKIIVFFVTFLPQFISVSDPHAASKLVFLGVLFVIIATPICATLILSADRIAVFLKQSPKALRYVDWVVATVFGGFAIKLLATRAN